MPRGPLARWVDPLVTQPLGRTVPADDATYRARKGELRLAVRGIRRALQLRASGQAPLRRERIDPAWRRLLWIHEEAPQIGDALMDLAPRSLLAERGIEVDLVAPPPIAALFAADRWLARSFAAAETIDPGRYDAVVTSSDSRRALRTKRLRAPALPWVSIAGRYNAPDYQRAMFAAQRLADLLGIALDDDAMRWHARQKLDPVGAAPPDAADDAVVLAGLPPRRAGEPRIAIACGGVRDERIYGHWPEVAARLSAGGLRAFATLGSANGRPAADAVAAALPRDAMLHDRVARGDLQATRAAVEHCDLLLCADGGLMHLGLTTAVPIVALFTATVAPAWRLPTDFDGVALRSATPEVGDIPPERVVEAVFEVLRSRPD